jgi:hypothetical protein
MAVTGGHEGAAAPTPRITDRPVPGQSARSRGVHETRVESVPLQVAFVSIASPAGGSNEASLRYGLAGAGVSLPSSSVGRRILERGLGPRSPGTHELRWECRDGNGRRVPAGLYWVRIQADSKPALTARWFIPR